MVEEVRGLVCGIGREEWKWRRPAERCGWTVDIWRVVQPSPSLLPSSVEDLVSTRPDWTGLDLTAALISQTSTQRSNADSHSSIRPLDIDTIIRSVKKTGHLVTVEGGFPGQS